MDLEDLKSKITSKSKIFVLCSPHNPVGRLWKKEELEQLAKICADKKLVPLFDFAYQPHYSLWLYLPIVSTLVIGWVSYIHIRHVPRTAPMEILRQYS